MTYWVLLLIQVGLEAHVIMSVPSYAPGRLLPQAVAVPLKWALLQRSSSLLLPAA